MQVLSGGGDRQVTYIGEDRRVKKGASNDTTRRNTWKCAGPARMILLCTTYRNMHASAAMRCVQKHIVHSKRRSARFYRGGNNKQPGKKSSCVGVKFN